MPTYTYRVKIDTTDVTDATIAPLRWTNGRNTLADTLGKTWGSIEFFTGKLQDIYGFTPLSVVTFGQEITVEIYDTGTSSWTTAVTGKITDIASDRNTLTVTFVDRAIWTITRVSSVSLPTGNNNDLTAELADVIDAYITVTDNTTGGPYEVHWTIANTTNLGDWASQMIADVPSGLGYFHDKLVLEDRASTPTADLTLTADMIFDDYNIQRGIGDICNSVTVTYHNSGTYSETNATSVSAIGTRHVDVTSYLREAADAEVLARTFLGRFAPEGWPIVAFRTSAEQLGKTGKWVAENMFPNLVLDATTVSQVPFGGLMYLEQVEHQLGPNRWAMTLTVSDAIYSNLPQTWANVTPTLTWAAVTGTLTWTDLIYQDI